jgi:outer membrane protein TolC
MRSSFVFFTASMICLLLTGLPSMAQLTPTGGNQADEADAYPDDIDPTQFRPDNMEGEPLSLAEAIALGLQNNLDVQVNRYAPYESQMDSEGAWGAFDPTMTANVGQSSSTPIWGNALTPDDGSTATTGDVTFGALIPYVGATVGLTFDGGKNEGSSSFLTPVEPEYTSGLGFSGSLPLMRGLLWNEAWTQVKSSKLSYGAALDEFETSVMNTVQDIISSYWLLVATKEQERVAEKTLESNQALLDQTETQYQVGVVSRVEVVQAEAGVAGSEFDLIVAQNNYRNAQDQLIAAVLGDRLRASTTLIFNPTDNPQYQKVSPVDLEKAVANAFALRPEVKAAQKAIDQSDVQMRFAKNQRLPQFDIVGAYKTNGGAGLTRTDCQDNSTDPPTFIVCPQPTGTGRNWGSSAGALFGDTAGPTGQDYEVKGVFSIPIPNTTARKNVTKAKIQNRRARSSLTRLKQVIIVETRVAARGLLAAAQGVEAAERRRLAAAEQLRAERIRLEHGESTPFDVLLRQTDLVDAESQKIAALKAFRDSQVSLERAEGTILQNRSIMIDQVRALR